MKPKLFKLLEEKKQIYLCFLRVLCRNVPNDIELKDIKVKLQKLLTQNSFSLRENNSYEIVKTVRHWRKLSWFDYFVSHPSNIARMRVRPVAYGTKWHDNKNYKIDKSQELSYFWRIENDRVKKKPDTINCEQRYSSFTFERKPIRSSFVSD